MYKEGFSSISTVSNSNNSNNNLDSKISDLETKILSVRVRDIITSPSHPKFNTYGGWNGMGTVEFEIVDYTTKSTTETYTAKPLLPYLKNYPLVNEIILIFSLPNTEINKLSNIKSYYYLNSINLWNHPHHNGYPSLFGKAKNESQTKNYTSIEEGSYRRVKTTSTDIDLNSPLIGGTFKEKTNIHPLFPFDGDIILEGRFGNSLRLGNTSKTTSTPTNNWSTNGEDGSPITILRNGQPENSSEEGWLPIVENINVDLSSLYLTSTQKIPLIPVSNIYSGLSIDPTPVESYNKPQIIVNSGRIILNSNQDSILLSSNKNINLSSINDIGISTKDKITLYSPQVKLGDKTAKERLILGDTFITQFNNLLNSLEQLCISLEAEPLLVTTPTQAALVKSSIKLVKNNLKNTLSNTVRTI